MEGAKRKCVSCGSSNLSQGTMGSLGYWGFVPNGASRMDRPYSPKTCLCLDCGFLHVHYDDKTLGKVKEWVAEIQEKRAKSKG